LVLCIQTTKRCHTTSCCTLCGLYRGSLYRKS